MDQEDPARHDEAEKAAFDAAGYWRANLKVMGVLLSIWFAVSFGAGILFARPLNAVDLPGTGFPLGFWFAQQGSIVVFVVLILAYVVLANRLDRAHGVGEDAGPV